MLNRINDDQKQACAQKVIDLHVRLMKNLREEARENNEMILSFQQFRSLKIVEKRNNISLSNIAEEIGLSLSSASKIIESLVEKNYVNRVTDAADRRKVVLTISEDGRSALKSIRVNLVNILKEKLNMLTVNECDVLNQAMDILRKAIDDNTGQSHAEL